VSPDWAITPATTLLAPLANIVRAVAESIADVIGIESGALDTNCLKQAGYELSTRISEKAPIYRMRDTLTGEVTLVGRFGLKEDSKWAHALFAALRAKSDRKAGVGWPVLAVLPCNMQKIPGGLFLPALGLIQRKRGRYIREHIGNGLVSDDALALAFYDSMSHATRLNLLHGSLSLDDYDVTHSNTVTPMGYNYIMTPEDPPVAVAAIILGDANQVCADLHAAGRPRAARLLWEQAMEIAEPVLSRAFRNMEAQPQRMYGILPLGMSVNIGHAVHATQKLLDVQDEFRDVLATHIANIIAKRENQLSGDPTRAALIIRMALAAGGCKRHTVDTDTSATKVAAKRVARELPVRSGEERRQEYNSVVTEELKRR